MKYLLSAVLALGLSGCAGYHIGPVKPRYLEAIKSIAVPTFKNETLEPRIEVLVADVVIKQFQQDGTYEITSENRADAVLDGTITKIERSSARSLSGNVIATREFELTLTIDYTLRRRGTKEPVQHNSVSGRTNFFVSSDVQQDERQALPLAAQEAAVALVSELSEGW